MSDKPNVPGSSGKPYVIEMMSDLYALERDNPRAIEIIAQLYDDSGARESFARKMLSILPSVIDADGILHWLEGGALPPTPVRLADPDRGRPKGARGAQQAARRRHDAALTDVAAARAKLDAANAAEAASREELKEAESHLRMVTFGKVYNTSGEQFAAAGELGPAWTILRAISGYLQIDVAWENSLSIERREGIAEHRRQRKENQTEMLHLLDRYCGDEELEIELHNVILGTLRRVHAEVEQERERAKYGGGKLSERAKRTRRTREQWRKSVHPMGKLADRKAVLDGLQGVTGSSGTD